MTAVGASVVDLSRVQFATTSLYHFLFVPLTLGLAPLVAVMQTIWHRTGVQAWLRLTRFFGTLLIINFAVGVATGLVQEFQFGMNWSVYSRYVGDVFGAPLAVEGLAAFFLESTFLGLWIFGWDHLSPRIHLATIWLAAIGTWLSAYFILVANSWMQKPVGYHVTNGKAELTNIWHVLDAKWTLWAFGHTILAALTTASAVVFGVACWHFVRGRNQELFRHAAKLGLIVLVPASALNLWFGSNFGIVVTQQQPMKISAVEAQWNTCQPCSFSLFQIGGFTTSDQTPSFSIAVPGLLSFLATGSFHGKVEGINQLQADEAKQHGPGNYIPPVEAVYWSMRIMAYLGTLVFLVSAVGAYLYRRKRLEHTRWFNWVAVASIALPFLAALSGWALTELGRQPWIVFGLLRTSDAVSPTSTVWTVGASLAVFGVLYAGLTILDFVLLRRYARLDPPEPEAEKG